MVATEASLALTRKLISEKVVQGAEAEMWLAGLAFIPRPTYSMLTMIKVSASAVFLLFKGQWRVAALLFHHKKPLCVFTYARQ